MAPVTVITGAASGIGRATALALAGAGRRLVLSTRGNADGLAAVAAETRAAGSETTTHLADLTQPGAAAGLIAHAVASFGTLDQIVSNAGHAQKGAVAETTDADLDHAIAVNTKPFLALVTAARAGLEASPRGRVVAVSSFVATHHGLDGTLYPASAASKAALVSLSKSLAFELAASGVTVNCVSPGYTQKDSGRSALDPAAWARAAKATPNGRLAQPADIAAAIAFFLSDPARHITGQVLEVDGGLSLL